MIEVLRVNNIAVKVITPIKKNSRTPPFKIFLISCKFELSSMKKKTFKITKINDGNKPLIMKAFPNDLVNPRKMFTFYCSIICLH